jgi:hypothetical protein
VRGSLHRFGGQPERSQIRGLMRRGAGLLLGRAI